MIYSNVLMANVLKMKKEITKRKISCDVFGFFGYKFVEKNVVREHYDKKY